jgi:hypothetical protein
MHPQFDHQRYHRLDEPEESIDDRLPDCAHLMRVKENATAPGCAGTNSKRVEAVRRFDP